MSLMSSKKTIFINLLAARDGGQITRAKAFLARIRKYDEESTVIVLQSPNMPPFADYEAEHITVCYQGFLFKKITAVQRMFWEEIKLPSMLRRLGVDRYITFSHFLPLRFPPEIYSIVGVSNVAPFSKEAWNAESSEIKFKMFLQKLSIISSCKRASQVLALSELCKGFLMDEGVEGESISVIYNGVEVSNRPLRGEDILGKYGVKTPFMLYVSNFHMFKNHLRLVEAFSLIPSNKRGALRLLLVGKIYNKKYYADILALIDKKGLADFVQIITGLPADELAEVYSAATMFTFPSLIENCPNILLEAQAYGLPISCCSLPPMPEFCGSAATYYSAEDADDMAEKMALYMGDDAGLEKLGAAAKAKSAKYSWDKFTKDMVQFYKQ